MSLSDLASFAIIVQGFLFVVSIALVWYQLHENTKLVRAANTQKLVELSVPFNLQNHWPRLKSFFESSFAEHVMAIIARQTQEVQ